MASPPFSVDALLCEEDHCWDDGDHFKAETLTANFSTKSQRESPEDFSWDDQELTSLFTKEHKTVSGKKPCLIEARVEAVEWMLKVIAYFSFSALTAVLAVNYLDRFLRSSFRSRRDKPWMAQLAAVACLSLAAKVEETRVPLLTDLQVDGSKFVFESKTIRRMEIVVLSTLEWKMNPVTPLSFVDHVARRLALKGQLCGEFLKRCHLLILSLVSDCRFMSYLPSALAAATMLYVLSSLDPCGSLQYQDQLKGILGIDKETLEDCCELIQEVATTTNVEFQTSIKKRKIGSLPESPKGVFDVSFSSDSSNDSWALPSVSSSPETLSKKMKPQMF